MSVSSMTLVGGYDPAYPRTDVIIKGCAANGIDVRHLRIPWGPPIRRTWRLGRLLKKTRIETDFAFVPAMCHHEVAVVKKRTDRPVIFDPLFSRYLTKIHDYRTAGRFSLHAAANFRADRISMSRADYVLADTLANKGYYCRTFGISPDKIFPLYVGYNSDDFHPVEHARSEKLRVGFYGTFNPLQGVHVIVQAARILRGRSDIVFELVGSGHTFQRSLSLARTLGVENIVFTGSKPYEQLCETIGRWDICLGIFGETLKAGLVVPNKVYHYAGCRKAIITKDTPAIREVFTPDKDVHLTDGSPEDLAEAVTALCDDGAYQERLAREAHHTVSAGYSHLQIGRRFREYLDQWI